MAPLSDLRQIINGIDDQIVDLLERRAELMEDVLRAKLHDSRGWVRDPLREHEVLDRLVRRNGRFPAAAMRAIFREVMSACVSLQEQRRVAFLGPDGSLTDEAAYAIFGASTAYVGATTIRGVLETVSRGEAAVGVVPVESTLDGIIGSALDGLVEFEHEIRAELVMDLQYCLLGRGPTLANVVQVYATPHAVGQCSHWLAEHLPAAKIVHLASPALIAREVIDPKSAVIGSLMLGHRFNIPVLHTRIENTPTHTTRYFVVGEPNLASVGDKTTLAIWPDTGGLDPVVANLRERGVKVSRIDSRPDHERRGSWLFVIEVNGVGARAAAVDAIAGVARRIKVLGSYATIVQ